MGSEPISSIPPPWFLLQVPALTSHCDEPGPGYASGIKPPLPKLSFLRMFYHRDRTKTKNLLSLKFPSDAGEGTKPREPQI